MINQFLKLVYLRKITANIYTKNIYKSFFEKKVKVKIPYHYLVTRSIFANHTNFCYCSDVRPVDLLSTLL